MQTGIAIQHCPLQGRRNLLVLGRASGWNKRGWGLREESSVLPRACMGFNVSSRVSSPRNPDHNAPWRLCRLAKGWAAVGGCTAWHRCCTWRRCSTPPATGTHHQLGAGCAKPGWKEVTNSRNAFCLLQCRQVLGRLVVLLRLSSLARRRCSASTPLVLRLVLDADADPRHACAKEALKTIRRLLLQACFHVVGCGCHVSPNYAEMTATAHLKKPAWSLSMACR